MVKGCHNLCPGLSVCDNLGVESPKSVTHIDDMVVNVTSVPHYDVTNISNVTNMSDVNNITLQICLIE